MMYIPEVDRASEDEWSALVARADVIEIIAPGVDRAWPVVAPVHAIWGERNFRCHFARSNPIWEALEEDSRAMVSIHGSWSYIPGSWKAPNDSSPELGVPTSFYWSVQLYCHAYVIDDPDGIAEILRDLLSKFEESPSELADPVVAHAAKLAHIRGLHLNPIEVNAKIKIGGNLSSKVRSRVATKLKDRAEPSDLDLLHFMDVRGYVEPL